MRRFVTALVLSSLCSATTSRYLIAQMLDSSSSPAASFSADMGAVPRGNSTVFGGEIQRVDPVRDQLTLRVYGERPMKILFDERTEVYRDGQRMSLGALKPEERASVQTTLDGTRLFALSIHMLSNSAEGECEGRVLGFNAESGELTVNSLVAGQDIQVLVEGRTAFARKGQAKAASVPAGPADLVDGTLVAVEFAAAGKEMPVAHRVTILAVPNSNFVFSGHLRALDVHSGLLILIDPRNHKSYQLAFAPLSPAVQNLHVGDDVRVVAKYNGKSYVATEIAKQ